MCIIIGDVCCALGSLSSLLHGWMRTCSCWAEDHMSKCPGWLRPHLTVGRAPWLGLSRKLQNSVFQVI